MIAAAACLLLLWIWPVSAAALTALAVTGVSYGAMAGAYPAVVAQLYGAAEASRVYARVFTSWGIAGLAGPYVGGLLFDRAGTYDAALVAGACAAALAAVVCVAIPSPRPTASQRAGPTGRG
jgi:OFA family oxalate/formate antiporter-like MFS transporter